MNTRSKDASVKVSLPTRELLRKQRERTGASTKWLMDKAVEKAYGSAAKK